MNIVLISSTPQKWRDCLPVFEETGITARQCATLEEGLELVRREPPALVLFDMPGSPQEIRRHVVRLLALNAFVHIAVVSELPDEAFHEATEGLGILMCLPPRPLPADVRKLAERLAGAR